MIARINRLILLNKILRIIAAATTEIYVNADFDTIEKALPSRKMAEKGAKSGLPWSIADFRNPVLLYAVMGSAAVIEGQLTLLG